MKQSQSHNTAFHFSFNFDCFKLLKSTERRSAHLKCLCLCTCSLEKLWIQQGFSCYPFYFHHSCICKHRPFKTPTAMTVLPAAQDLLVLWRPLGQTKRLARGSPLTATEVPDLRARICLLLSCWLRARGVKPLRAVSTKRKQRHQNRESQFERSLHTNHPLLEVHKLCRCTSDSLWACGAHCLVCSDHCLQVTWGKGTSLQHNSFPFGFWSQYWALSSWSLTSSSTTALEGAESTCTFSSFPPFSDEGTDGAMAGYSPVSWEMQI